MTKLEIMEQLRSGICKVCFTKKDGSIREMDCTLLSQIIVDNNLSPKGQAPVISDIQIRCIDTNIMEWRSFNIDTIISFTGPSS